MERNIYEMRWNVTDPMSEGRNWEGMPIRYLGSPFYPF